MARQGGREEDKGYCGRAVELWPFQSCKVLIFKQGMRALGAGKVTIDEAC